MAKISAGLLLYRLVEDALEVLLIHPGGPFWKNKDLGAWSIPKGEANEGEVLLDAARREFEEETGFAIAAAAIELGALRQRSGKTVHVWAANGNIDAEQIQSNEFEMEWPPRSGKMQSFPEADRAEWFSIEEARKRILPGQVGFLDRLEAVLKK